MHFQSPPFWWLMTTLIKAYKRYINEAFRCSDLDWAPPKYVQSLNSTNLASNAIFAHIHENIELPLNLNICGVQNKCVNMYNVMHMTNISQNIKWKKWSVLSQCTRHCRVAKLGTAEYIRHTRIYLCTRHCRVARFDTAEYTEYTWVRTEKIKISSKQSISTH